MDLLLGNGLGSREDRKTIRLAVGRYLTEAYRLRKARYDIQRLDWEVGL